ncbi:MAG TPA: glycosyl hydrolase 108 family protein [Hyphomicrobiales bacterium]|nr:glycosyl hydrolase 108 family protein [Hyphomicrobiales bacterium]
MAASGFDACLRLVLLNEGGWSDDARDPGGATNRGITRATLARWRGRPASKMELRALGRAEAARI